MPASDDRTEEGTEEMNIEHPTPNTERRSKTICSQLLFGVFRADGGLTPPQGSFREKA